QRGRRRSGLLRGGREPLLAAPAPGAGRADGAAVRHGVPRSVRGVRNARARRGRDRGRRRRVRRAARRAARRGALMQTGFFFQALVYLCAAVVAVPIARRLGLGSVLGYLLAGAAIGPFALGLVGREGADVLHFAEVGVV